MRKTIKRNIPLLILVICIVAFFALGLDDYVTFHTLKYHRQSLLELVTSYAVIAPIIYMLTYTTLTAMSIPGGAAMTITGGFLFGSILGTCYVVVAATAGATLLFLIAKSALSEPLRKRAGPWLQKMSTGFQENAMSYLLFLRLIPLFPFFVVNLVPAFLGVKARTYVIGTFFGIMPGTFVYSSVGAGVGSVFDAGEEFEPSHVLTPQVIIALVGLAILAILPVVYKKLKS